MESAAQRYARFKVVQQNVRDRHNTNKKLWCQELRQYHWCVS